MVPPARQELWACPVGSSSPALAEALGCAGGARGALKAGICSSLGAVPGLEMDRAKKQWLQGRTEQRSDGCRAAASSRYWERGHIRLLIRVIYNLSSLFSHQGCCLVAGYPFLITWFILQADWDFGRCSGKVGDKCHQRNGGLGSATSGTS